jgi:hypothetical protein
MSKADFDLRPATLGQQELEHSIHNVVEDNILKDRFDKSKPLEFQDEDSACPPVVGTTALVQGVSQKYPAREKIRTLASVTLDHGVTPREPNHTSIQKSEAKRNACFSGNCVIAVDTQGKMYGKLLLGNGGKQTESNILFSGSLIKTYRDCMRDEEWTLALLNFQNVPGTCGARLDLLAECSGGDALDLCSPIELNAEELSYLSNRPIFDKLLSRKTIFIFTCHCLRDAQCHFCCQGDMDLEKQVVDSDVQSILNHFDLETDKINCINSGVFKLHLV